MQWYEIGILSIVEMIAIIFIWSKVNTRIKVYNKKSIFTIIIMSVIAVILDKYEIDIGFVIIFTLLCYMMGILFRIYWKNVIIEFAIVFIIVISIQFILTYILRLFIDVMTYSFTNGLIINITMLFTCYLIYEILPMYGIRKCFLNYKNNILVIMINIISIILIFMYIWQVNKELVWTNMGYALIIIAVWLCLNVFFLYQHIRIQQQQQIIQIHERYLPILKNMVDEVRQKQHDFKNHLNVLYGLAQFEDTQDFQKEITNYIDTLIGEIKPIDQVLNMKDPILSAIIYYKKSEAENKEIFFELKIQGEVPKYPLEKYELVEILGNLLDNAIEAVDNSDHRSILVILGVENNKPMIEIKNSGKFISNRSMDKIFDKGFSTKKGKHRGYGLYNVKKIVDHYNGTIELSLENMYVSFKTLF